MPEPIRTLNTIKIVSPCQADWHSMTGNDQVRFCEHCNLHVNDISAMTRPAAMRLVRRSRGRLCLRFVQAPDGTPLIGHVPEKLHRIGRRISRIAAGAFSATLGLSAAAAQTRSVSNPPPLSEVANTARTNSPREVGTTLAGVVVDANGALVAGATLSLSNRLAHIAYTYTTADDGAYKFVALEPGIYTLVAEAATFARTEKAEIVLRPNVETALDLTMEVPQLIAEVEIKGAVTMGMVAMSEPENPLVHAAYKNDLSAVAELALTSANVNVTDRLTNTTALAHAIENTNREMVQVLLSAGADVNARNSYGTTPFMHLGERATVELVRDLLAAGADLHAADESGTTALLKIAGSSKLEVVTELINAGARIDVKDNRGTTVLMNAAENEDARVVKFFIAAGLDVAARNDNGETALMQAVQWGGTDTVRALSESGTAINAADDEGKTALMYAADNDDPEISRMLIDKGAEVNRKDEDGNTALMLAAAEGNTAIMQLLLAAGAEVDARDNEGQTALMRADDAESVRVLLKAHADLSLKDNNGQTALARARKDEEEEIVKLLVSRRAPE